MPLLMPPDELNAWIRLTLEPGIGPVQARHLLAAIGLPQEIFQQSTGQLLKWLPPALAGQLSAEPGADIQEQIERTLAWLDHPDHHILTLADPAYPSGLLETHDPPPVLYVNGAPDLLNRPGIAIVGARHATAGGMENARAFARHLALEGWNVVSGLASGIDTAAHEGALDTGSPAGSTIAVLGTGIDIVYPARNRSLAHRIAHAGALVSEFPLGCKALPHQFPRRNRIVAGLVQGVLVVEAALKSGSLITARHASEAGRDVFAIPGSIHSPLSKGCHALIRQGAKLVESGQDIIEELRSNPAAGVFTLPVPGPCRISAIQNSHPQHDPVNTTPVALLKSEKPARSHHRVISAFHQKLLDAAGFDPVSIDVLIERTELDIVQINRILTELELAGALQRLPDGRIQRLATPSC